MSDMCAQRLAYVFSVLLLTVTGARADVFEPNGEQVPTDDTGANDTRLDQFFTDEAEAIDWKADAFSTPATFAPQCGFRATLKLVESGSKFGVGWYNVDPAALSAPTEVIEIIPQNATPGLVITDENIRSSPSYAGGLIGFALIRSGDTPAYHYSESQWNTLCSACTTPGEWVLSIVYKSQNIPNAWYMGFEDGDTTAVSWSNDGDFNDSLFLFEGLSCDGGGEPCVVPDVEGVCRAGLTECAADGMLACKQVVQPGTEVCDGIDNDCQGGIDEGDELCDEQKICVQGSCVHNCSLEEFPCAPGLECDDSVCVHPECVGKECEAGKACVEGECIAPCDDVVCPGTQECILGRCIDPCAGVTCDDERVCDRGVCVESCGCRGCTDDLECNSGSGQCVPTGCGAVTCDDGEICTEGGACEPLCNSSVTCPHGQGCSAGQCVPGAETDGGVPGGAGGSDGAGTGGGSAAVGDGGTAGTSGGGAGAAGSKSGTLGRSGEDDQAGCGCRVATANDRTPTRLTALLLLALGIAWQRARRGVRG